MAIINRISRLFRADFHAVLDRIEEPEQLLRQAIRDMEDDLADTERRISLCAHDQIALSARKAELDDKIAGLDRELVFCFEADKDELARSLIRKKLEAERLLKRLAGRLAANEQFLEDQRAMFAERSATLEGLRQKAELFAQHKPARADTDSQSGEIAWMARELDVSDDDVEIAFLREKSARRAS